MHRNMHRLCKACVLAFLAYIRVDSANRQEDEDGFEEHKAEYCPSFARYWMWILEADGYLVPEMNASEGNNHDLQMDVKIGASENANTKKQLEES